jgi:Tol biopolymer transport system component
MLKKFVIIILVIFNIFLISGCEELMRTIKKNIQKTVPHEERFGIYELDPETGDVNLIYSTPNYMCTLYINYNVKRFVFSEKIDGEEDTDSEICSIGIDGTGFKRLTDNKEWDLYPAWSPDGSQIAFLSFRRGELDIYMMNSNGENGEMFLDTGYHDADIHWSNGLIAFTSNHRIWTVSEDGGNLKQITNPEDAGKWGKANLPIGDYDPRISPDGQKIVFERLVNPESTHGDYNLYMIDIDGKNEKAVTDTGYSQGLACWSNSGDKLAYVVAAIEGKGKYDIYTIDSDGSNNRNVTPEYFPEAFLCHSPAFSEDDTKIYFIGEWWE